MGQEFAQRSEWDFRRDLEWNTDERQQGVARLVGDLNQLYRGTPALHEGQFEPDSFATAFRDHENAVVGMTRTAPSGEDILFVHNTNTIEQTAYRIGVDEPGEYKERLNTDDAKYGGEDHRNTRPIVATNTPWHGKPHSIEVMLPALSTVAFQRT